MAASMINEIDIIQDEMGVLDEVELSSEDEEAYCLCGEENTLEMIGCDSNICEYEWFHYHCVGFTDETIPEAEVEWICDHCKEKSKKGIDTIVYKNDLYI